MMLFIVAHDCTLEPVQEPVEENPYLDVVKERKVNVSKENEIRALALKYCVLHRLLSL